MNALRKKRLEARVTIKTVAADAGVSVAAVSKVLRRAYGVSESLRKKVQASIKRLGYRPSIAARGMRGQTFKIGVLLTELSNPFLAEVMDGVNAVLEESRYQAILGLGQSITPMEAKLVESMIDYRMDGLILIAPHMDEKTLDRFGRQIPMVLIGHHEPSAKSFDTINSDDQIGAALAVQVFAERGYAPVAMLALDRDDPNLRTVESQREAGFRKSVRKLGIRGTSKIWKVPVEPHARPSAIEAHLRGGHAPRAIFCWSDLDAVHLFDCAKRRGLRIPEDLAIIGYDNSSVAALSSINLSSVDQSGKRLGSLAAEQLLSRIAGRKTPSHILIEPILAARSSH